MRKTICNERGCEWRGYENEILQAKNPFDASMTIYSCPKCHGVNTLVFACDEPDCWKEVACGTPTKTGYRSTCGQHIPKTSGG